MIKHVMGKGRLEAFTDGMVAIIITIMVLELKVPHGTDGATLLTLWPTFAAYIISFVTIAIFWVNHHQMVHQAKRIDHMVLWGNLIWLFFASLVPFTTAYLGESHVTPLAAMLYDANMCAVALGYLWLRIALACEHKDDPVYQAAHRVAVRKHYIGIAAYVVALPFAYVSPYIPVGVVLAVAASYFLPDAWVGEVESSA